MWQIWTSGILGIWIILLAFLDFSSTLTTFFLIATGVAVAALNFWLLSFIKVPERQHPDSEIFPSESSEPDIIIEENNEEEKEEDIGDVIADEEPEDN